MTQRPSPDGTARLLLWNLKEPSRLRADPKRSAELLDNEVVVKLALGRTIEFSDPALQRVDAAILRKAAAAYVRQYHFRPDASPYQVLGVAPDASAQAIRDSFRLLMQLVHPDRQDARTEWPEAFAARANRAYATLRDADSRAECDRELRQRDERERMARETANAAARVRQAHWPNAGQRVRKPPPQGVLPEWLTAGVGGFVRAHPAVMAFGSLIVVAALVIAGATWDTQTDSLARQTTSRTSPLAAAEPGPVADPEIFRQATVPDLVSGIDATPARLAMVGPTATSGGPASGARQSAAAIPAVPSAAAPAATTPDATRSPDPVVAVGSRPEPAVPAGSEPSPTVLANRAGNVVSGAAPTDVLPLAESRAAPVGIRAPSTDEVEMVMVAFVDAFDNGKLEAITALFAEDAQTNAQRGRAAIRRDFEELFRRSDRRRMQYARVSWQRLGEQANARAEGAVRISWSDGREVEQRFAMDMELVRRDGRVVITRLSRPPGAP